MATHTIPAVVYTVARDHMTWNPDGTRTLWLSYTATGYPTRYEPITLDANNALDRFGNVLVAQGAPFKTAMTTIETSIDGAITSLEAAGKLNPP